MLDGRGWPAQLKGEITPIVRGKQCLECVGCAFSGAHQIETLFAIAGLDERLGRDGSNAGFGPGHDCTDREPVRLNGHAKLTRCRVPRDDGERVDWAQR